MSSIKHLQLNTSVLRAPNEIVTFFQENKIDVACFQEVSFPIGSRSPLHELAERNNLQYTEAVHFHYLPKQQNIGVGILSRFPIIDSVVLYYNSPEYAPKNIETDNLINDGPLPHMPGSRGIAHSIKSRAILSVLVQTPTGPVRVITTHFTVSDLCTETFQMLEMSKMIWSLVSHAKDIPTIFSADLNIRAQSYSVLKISQAMECHSKDFTDTLSANHGAKQKDFPDGLAVDHVFSKGLEHISTDLVEVDFADHKALVSEFNL
jgi:endonuclease/exonuclease/phosphatase family metal-dependent hydrolase